MRLRVIRRPPAPPGRVLLALLAVPAAIAGGCSGASDPPTHVARTAIERSRARAIAPLLTIRAADLPEFKVKARPAAAPWAIRVAGEAACVRLPHRPHSQGTAAHSQGAVVARGARRGPRRPPSPQRPWARAHSGQLFANSGYQTLDAFSDVSIMPSAAAARLAVERASDVDAACMERALRRTLTKERLPVPVRGVVFEPLPLNAEGADASVAYRMVLGYRGAPLVAYVDLIYLSYGQDAMTLATYHASKPVPQTMDQRLLGLLVARARSHSH